MKRVLQVMSVFVMVFAVGAAAVAQPSIESNQNMEQRVIKQVRHELLMLPQFGIFDNLAYKVDGSTVTLMGQVRNAILKDEAAQAVKHIEGIEKIDNQIEILPASFNDDRIRRQVARALFNQPRLFNYAIQPSPPIHIIVKNGRVDLEGMVRDQGDKNVAGIMANGVPGVFAVQNDLQVEIASRN